MAVASTSALGCTDPEGAVEEEAAAEEDGPPAAVAASSDDTSPEFLSLVEEEA